MIRGLDCVALRPRRSLAFLGDTVIALVVTVVLGKALPLSRPGDLAVSGADQ